MPGPPQGSDARGNLLTAGPPSGAPTPSAQRDSELGDATGPEFKKLVMPSAAPPKSLSSFAGDSASESDEGDSQNDLCEEHASVRASHRFSREETVCIFDWDDTVLPSAWVQEQGLRLDADSWLDDWQRDELQKLAIGAAKVLRSAKRLGTVVLVTNAERGWIELSCDKFLPALYPSLENLKLLSARSAYDSPELTSPFEWKLRAFDHEIGRFFAGDPARRKNVISIGDSAHEREAVIHATGHIPNCRTKSLKLIERPSIDQLRRTHEALGRCMRTVVHHDGNLDLCIRPT